ncbi:MAG: hypothetical protein V7L22_00300 [Nostoc sp.]|uniref:hypothetical protein n=1 Tax=Nostoc sp. TaxID=1180 RepID=UPI002FFAFD2F
MGKGEREKGKRFKPFPPSPLPFTPPNHESELLEDSAIAPHRNKSLVVRQANDGAFVT